MDLSLSRSGKNPAAPAQAPGKQGYILYRGAWRLFESSLWFELEDGSDYLTAYAKPGSRPVLGIPLAKASIASPADKGKKPKAGKENKRCKLLIKTESGKEHTLVLNSEEQRDDWMKALTLARDLALSGDQLVKQWRDNGCQVCVGDASETEEAGGAEEILEPTPENTELIPPAALNARLEDIQGKVTSLKQILVGKRPVVMVLVRHFGCVLCRLILAKLRAVSPQLLRLGASIVVIGNGSPEMARNFKKQFDFNGKIYVDQLRTVYTALGCRRGFRFALSPSAMLRAKEAFGMGYSQGPVQGDTWQLGGLFVFSSPAGNILFAHNERFGGDSANLPEVISTVERHVRATDSWTMVPEPHPAWPSTITTSPAITSSIEHLIETSASPQGSYLVRKPSERNAGMALTYEATLDRQCLSPHYSQSLAPFPHQNYVSTEGVVSFEEPSPDKDSRAVIRTSESDFRVVVPAAYCGSAKEALQYLTDGTPVFAKATFVRVEGPKFVEALMAYEVSNLVRVYKFGVIPLRDHQISEDMWYANGASPAFETFVSALGEKVPLQGWQMYSGGLDTSGNRTGEFSRYTTFSGLEIMLHVAPYIPNTQADSQCLDRKRHIGNDVVVILFKEGRTAFNPSVVLSRFNHVFLVVEPKPGTESDADPSYHVSMCCKLGVPYFPPSIPAEIKRSQLRDFLLAKAVNGERAAMEASSFRDRLGKYRHVAIESLVKTYIGKDGRAAEGFSFLTNSNAVNAPLAVRGTSTSVSGAPGSPAVVRPLSPQLPNSTSSVAPLSPSSSSVSASVNAASESPLAESSKHATISHASRFGSSESKISRAAHSGSAPAQVANPQPVVPPLSARKEPSTELPPAPLSPVLSDPQKLALYTERVTQIEDLTARMRMLLLGGEANLFSIEMVMLQIHTLSMPLSRPPPPPSALPPMQSPPRATSPRPSPLANGLRPADRSSSASSASTGSGSDSNPNPNPNPLGIGPPTSPAPAPPLSVRPVSPARSAPPRVAAALIGVGRTSQSGGSQSGEPRPPL